jgi:hypothetical protein
VAGRQGQRPRQALQGTGLCSRSHPGHQAGLRVGGRQEVREAMDGLDELLARRLADPRVGKRWNGVEAAQPGPGGLDGGRGIRCTGRAPESARPGEQIPQRRSGRALHDDRPELGKEVEHAHTSEARVCEGVEMALELEQRVALVVELGLGIEQRRDPGPGGRAPGAAVCGRGNRAGRQLHHQCALHRADADANPLDRGKPPLPRARELDPQLPVRKIRAVASRVIPQMPFERGARRSAPASSHRAAPPKKPWKETAVPPIEGLIIPRRLPARDEARGHRRCARERQRACNGRGNDRRKQGTRGQPSIYFTVRRPRVDRNR